MEIIKTKPEDANFHLFEMLPGILYPEDSLRHLEKENINKEFLYTCYVLTINDQPKARVALYQNPNLFYEGLKAACIGNYESVDDASVSEYLLRHVVKEARSLGARFLIGPMNGSTWDNYRFSVHHYRSNFLLEPYHFLYYNYQFVKAGFSPISNYSSSIDNQILYDHPEILIREKELGELGVKIRNIDKDDYEGELQRLYPFLTSSFSCNFLYTDIAEETFLNKYKGAFPIVNPEYVQIAEDSKGEIIGFIFSYDDIFNREEKSLIVKTVVRNGAKTWAGLGHVMSNRIVRSIKEKGYQSVIHAFMHQTATSAELSKSFYGVVYKNYILYGMTL